MMQVRWAWPPGPAARPREGGRARVAGSAAACLTGLLLVVAWGWVYPGEAAAQLDRAHLVERVKALSTKGVALQKEGRYQEAVETFLQAYEVLPLSTLLYNIARVYDKMGRVKDAVEYYRRYIVAENTRPRLFAIATERYHALNKKLERERLASEVEGPGGPKVEDWPLEETSRASPVEHLTSSSTNAAWITLGAGTLSALTGVAFGISARATYGDYSSSRALDAKEDLKASAWRQAVAADVFMGLGLTAMVTGGVWLLLESLDSASKPVETQR